MAVIFTFFQIGARLGILIFSESVLEIPPVLIHWGQVVRVVCLDPDSSPEILPRTQKVRDPGSWLESAEKWEREVGSRLLILFLPGCGLWPQEAHGAAAKVCAPTLGEDSRSEGQSDLTDSIQSWHETIKSYIICKVNWRLNNNLLSTDSWRVSSKWPGLALRLFLFDFSPEPDLIKRDSTSDSEL